MASKKNFNFLVTIREEDWNSIEVGDRFSFSEIELTFEPDEAELIYDSLNNYNKDLKFVDFNNAAKARAEAEVKHGFHQNHGRRTN